MKFWKNSKGAVTVIVTLLLIPSILISGTAVDVARIYSAKSVVQDANLLGANAAMAQYNALLKDLYGLYGIKDTNLQSMVNDYIKLAIFGDENTGKEMGTFQLFYGSESSLSISTVSERNLGELEVLQRQIEEYMALRAPVIIADDIMEIIDSMKMVSVDSEVIRTKLEIDDGMEEIYEIYKAIYQTINKLDNYPAEESTVLWNINNVLGKIQGQFSALKTVRTDYIKLLEDFVTEKENWEKELNSMVEQAAAKEATKAMLNMIKENSAVGSENANESDGSGRDTESEITDSSEEEEVVQEDETQAADDTTDEAIKQIDSELESLNQAITEQGKKITLETANYETKKLECELKYQVILSNITALASGGILFTLYQAGSTGADGVYVSGSWGEQTVIIGGEIGAAWGDNMSLSACKTNADNTLKHFNELIQTLVSQMNEAEEKKAQLKANLSSLKSKLNDCSESLKSGLTDKKEEYGNQSLLEYYEKVLEYDLGNMAGEVTNTNQTALDHVQQYLDEMGYGIAENGITGGLEMGSVVSIENLSPVVNDEFKDINYARNNPNSQDILSLYAGLTAEQYSYVSQNEFKIFKDISENTGKFYRSLEELMESTGTKKESEIRSSISQLLKAAKVLLQGAGNFPEGADSYSVSIGSGITSGFGTNDNWDDTNEVKKSAKNALSNPILTGLGSIINDCSNKLLLVTYGTAMFSNYATNKPNAANKKETSLTECPLGVKVNYFYQSEQEFLFNGSQYASENLDAVTGMIFLVRFIMNYVSSFTLSEVNELVRSVMISLPFPASVIASELTRFALVVGQSVIDINKLRMGYRVPLIHTQSSQSWQMSPSGLVSMGDDAVSLLNGFREGNDQKVEEGTGFSYTNYLSALLLFVDKNTLTQRTKLLIELNLTNYKNNVGADTGKMLSLERICLDRYATGISITTGVEMKTLFFTMSMFQNGINGVKPNTTYTIRDTVYRGY